MPESSVQESAASAPATMGRLPDFIVIGAMKAGTTSLYAYLQRHPQLFMAKRKEPMFFSRDAVYAQGLAWYMSLFSGASPDQLCGEGSTCYTRCKQYPSAAARIAQHAPNAKLIYIMRHPVERAYSHYAHRMQERHARNEGPVVSFEQYLDTDDEVTSASLYLMQIKHYLKHFDRERLLLLLFDDLKNKPKESLEHVQRFLGIECIDLVQEAPIAENRGGARLARFRIYKYFRNQLREMRKMPVISSMVDALPPLWREEGLSKTADILSGSVFGNRMAKDFSKKLSPLTPETRARLLQQFEQPTRQLAAFLDRDLSGWFV